MDIGTLAVENLKTVTLLTNAERGNLYLAKTKDGVEVKGLFCKFEHKCSPQPRYLLVLDGVSRGKILNLNELLPVALDISDICEICVSKYELKEFNFEEDGNKYGLICTSNSNNNDYLVFVPKFDNNYQSVILYDAKETFECGEMSDTTQPNLIIGQCGLRRKDPTLPSSDKIETKH